MPNKAKKFSNIGKIESQLLEKDLVVAGVDEVGKGALAGPVCAGAVVLDFTKLNMLSVKEKSLIRDSKTLSEKQRKESSKIIERIAIVSSVGFSTVDQVFELGLSKATYLAMTTAINNLSVKIDLLLVDGKYEIPSYFGKQRTVIGGDNLCYNIAAASILAKLARDKHMKAQAELYPHYFFDKNVGYGTSKHLESIKDVGICPIHRKGFRPIADRLAKDDLFT